MYDSWDQDKYVYILAHLPKTGGQTLRAHFARHLRLHEEFIHLGRFGVEDAEERGLLPFEERSLAERRRAFIIQGHQVTHRIHTLVPGKKPRYVIFLRNPAARIVSLYNFVMYHQYTAQGKAPISFDEFEEWRKAIPKENFWAKNMDAWIWENFLDLEQITVPRETVLSTVKATLDRFWFVGITEAFAEDAAVLMEALRLPPIEKKENVSGVHFEKTLKLTDALRERLYREHPNDLTLYQMYSKQKRY